jgi:hypothetical protein
LFVERAHSAATENARWSATQSLKSAVAATKGHRRFGAAEMYRTDFDTAD